MFEAEIRDLLAPQLAVIEPGLSLMEIERYIPSEIGTRSFIDILAKDARGRFVLIELKRSGAASRQAIHEIYKYVEAVKTHLGARDNEIRTIIVSTEWQELLMPFSRFVVDTNITVKGVHLVVDEVSHTMSATDVKPLAVSSGRVLSPWHEVSLYTSDQRVLEGISSYDASCKTKGIDNYVMVVLTAPDGFYEASVLSTAKNLQAIRGESGEPTSEEISELSSKMEKLERMIYFVPNMQSAEEYLEIIRTNDADLYEEARGFPDAIEGDELLQSLQSYALDAAPKVSRDYFEIGYPAKFKSKLIENEGWEIREIHRRGVFARNELLTDETIIGEIAGEAGTSGQRLKRSILLSHRSEVSLLMEDIANCLSNNSVWAGMLQEQLSEAQADFPNGTAELSLFAPSAGIMTLYFVTTHDDGVLYVPTYTLTISEDEELRRVYIGELRAAEDEPATPRAFVDVLKKYYGGEIGALTMSMTWGGYEWNDIDILEHLNLIYSSFRCDCDGDQRRFLKKRNARWKPIPPIGFMEGVKDYLDRNDALIHTIVRKLQPRIGPICDGSSSEMQLAGLVDPATVGRGRYYANPSEDCDICGIPLAEENFMSDCRAKKGGGWGNMCADCTVYYGSGIGWGVGQLYRNENEGRWLQVAGGPEYEDQLDD